MIKRLILKKCRIRLIKINKYRQYQWIALQLLVHLVNNNKYYRY